MGLLVLKHKKPKLYFGRLYRIRLFQLFQAVRCLDSQLYLNHFHQASLGKFISYKCANDVSKLSESSD